MAPSCLNDFAGEWLLESVGDQADELLALNGYGWVQRKFAKGIKYGVGKYKFIIAVEGEKLTLTEKGRQTVTNIMEIGKEGKYTLMDGTTVVKVVGTKFDSSRGVIEATNIGGAGSGAIRYDMDRLIYIEEGKLVMEIRVADKVKSFRRMYRKV